MGTGYTRNDTSNNIADGNIINAADLDGEFDAIESAFGTSGHTHDGTSAEGGPITVLGPVQDFVASATEIKPKTTNTLDIGTNSLLFKDMFLDGVATVGSIKIDNAGTIGSASDADAITISSGGVVTFSQAVSNLGNVTGKTSSGFVLALQTSDTTIEATNVLGKIEFSAPDEASGTDAILVGASIEALAEDTFDSSTNSTALVFKTNTTGAATERMRLTSAGDLHFLDNRKAIFGAGSDLQIYHDGSNSIIEDTSTGNLQLITNGNAIALKTSDGDAMVSAIKDGDVKLYYNNNLKLATTSTGVDITGTITSDGLTVDGTVTGNIASFINDGNSTNAKGIKIQGGTDNGFGENYKIEFFDGDGTASGRISTNTGSINIEAAPVTINEGGSDYDFRVESNGNANMLLVDAGNNRIGIGKVPSTNTLDVSNSVNIAGDTAPSGDGLGLGDYSTTGSYKWIQSFNSQALRLNPLGNEVSIGISGQVTNFKTFGNTVINEDGADQDFRVESDLDSHMLFVDASTNRVGINRSSPDAPLHLQAGSSGGSLSDAFQISDNSYVNIAMYSGGADGEIRVGAAGVLRGSYKAQYAGTRSAHDFHIGSNSTNMISFDGGGSAVIVNEAGADRDFRVESDSNSHALFVDAGNNSVAMGTSAPSSYVNSGGLAVKGSTFSDLALISSSISAGSNSHQIRYYNDTGTVYEIARTRVNVGAGQVNRGEYQFAVNNGAGLRRWLDVDYSGNVIFNADSHDSDFRVSSDNNTHMLFVDAGNDAVGIGASVPQAPLQVQKALASDGAMMIARNTRTRASGVKYGLEFRDSSNEANAVIQIEQTGSNNQARMIFQTNNATGGNGIDNGVESLRLFPSENVFNEDSANQNFRVESNDQGHMLFVDAGENAVWMGLSTPASGGFNSTTKFVMNATSDYVLGLRTTNSSGTNNEMVDFRDGDDQRMGLITGNASANTVTYGTSSDRSLKENDRPIPNPVDRVKVLNPVLFDWISDGSSSEGFIAQELEQDTQLGIDAVAGKEGEKNVDYGKLTPLLTAALQEAITKIETLEARILALENA